MPTRQESLFNQKLLKRKIPTEATPSRHKEILEQWAAAIRSGSIRKHKESELRGPFIQRFYVEILGYVPFGSGSEWTINDEQRTGKGAADTALGLFSDTDKVPRVPVELKGADTADLDAIMPGRHKSPVQQVWEYANDTPECQFMIVSNMHEFRLYAVSGTRQVYERFDVVEIAESDFAYQKFITLLGYQGLIEGRTLDLLYKSAEAQKEITDELYSDYKAWRVHLLVSLMKATGKTAESLIEPVQKLLDRILFVAFAEDRGLLPEKTLSKAFEHRDPYTKKRIWDNFLGLFRAIDKGDSDLKIPAYNGGLFAEDLFLESLPISDETCEIFRNIGDYDFAEEISVSVLGHIFEQSVSDLEKLKDFAKQEELTFEILLRDVGDKGRSVSGKRKSDGIVYTPDSITRFIVNKTLGSYLDRLRKVIESEFVDDKEIGWRKPTKAEKALVGRRKQVKLKSNERLVEFLFWVKWREALSKVRVVDPACGSGAFLVAAFDLLDLEYFQANEQIQAITGNPDLFDINREILNSNLYGVDINAESIEISKLSLWLKTAQHGKPLESLEANLLVGDSIVSDKLYTNKPFDWRNNFSAVFQEGGFDVVLANPPYVRMELLRPIKGFLAKEYTVTSDRADIYQYFYELGVNILKDNGRLGYISSSTFFKSRSGRPLRHYLTENTKLIDILYFSDVQIFEGVTTYPAIVVAEKSQADADENYVRALALKNCLPRNLDRYFEQNSFQLQQCHLKEDGWYIDSSSSEKLWGKLVQNHPSLQDSLGHPLYGIKSGCDSAFLIDAAKRKELLKKDPNSAQLIFPYLEGKNIRAWASPIISRWIIFIPKNRVDIDHYPAIKAHLNDFRGKLENRATNQEWFELQQPQERYTRDFSQVKIVYPDIASEPRFTLDQGSYLSTTSFCIRSESKWLLGLLNSSAIWWIIKRSTPLARGGYHRLKAEYINKLPVPEIPTSVKKDLNSLVESEISAANSLQSTMLNFRKRFTTDLMSAGASVSRKLEAWYKLSFDEFHNELIKKTGNSIPLKDRSDWQDLFEKNQEKIFQENLKIDDFRKKIETLIAQAFQLTDEEAEFIKRDSGLIS